MTRPPAEVEISSALVRALLTDQHPDLADAELAHVGGGWDNELYRLGADLAVRLPRRQAAADLVPHEHRWLGELSEGLPLATSAPVRRGGPGCGFPWPWSVVPWFEGRSAARQPPDDLAEAARVLGDLTARLHRPAAEGAPPNPVRGIPLRSRDEAFRRYQVAAGDRLDQEWVDREWTAALELPHWTGPLTWLHGDLHPGNVLVHDGRLAALIDWGDLTAGDPAGDLAIGWMLLDEGSRPILRERSGCDDPTWGRARGWALMMAVLLVDCPPDDDLFGVSERTFRELGHP